MTQSPLCGYSDLTHNIAGARAARNPYTLRRSSFGVISLVPSQSGHRLGSSIKQIIIPPFASPSFTECIQLLRPAVNRSVCGVCDGGRELSENFIFRLNPLHSIKPCHSLAWYDFFRVPRIGFKTQDLLLPSGAVCF